MCGKVQIQVLNLKSSMRWAINRQLYEYSAEGKYPWLQRLCFKILGKLDAYYNEKVEVITIEANPVDLIDQVIAQMNSADIMNRAGTKILMGARNFYALRDRPDCWQYLELPLMQARIGYRNETRLFGLEVVVIPWMDGILVVP